jgi:hypothetical protein
MNIQTKIAKALQEIGGEKCLKKAIALKQNSNLISTLNLRDLDLTPLNMINIASCFEGRDCSIKSISFSYNRSLNDSGAVALMKKLPTSILEIGLVNCGINDIGGAEILNWMRSASSLRMICIEQNNFSENLKSEFKQFSNHNPQILVVY